MKKAFTMIELVFVIVILGLLASVAIPKLAATRDDAEVMAGLQRVNSMILDIGSYYTANGIFAEVENMTNENLVKADFSTFTGTLTGNTAYFANIAKTKKCLAVTISDMNGTLVLTNLNDGSSFCLTLVRQLGKSVGSHHFGGTSIY